jgi:hypothetical protein
MYAAMGSKSYMFLSTFHILIGYNDSLLAAQHVHFDLDILFNGI